MHTPDRLSRDSQAQRQLTLFGSEPPDSRSLRSLPSYRLSLYEDRYTVANWTGVLSILY